MVITLVDIQDIKNKRIAFINGDEMMYAASLPKIAILLAAEDALEKGQLKGSPEVINDMNIMISKSDNQAASRMINRTFPRLNQRIKPRGNHQSGRTVLSNRFLTLTRNGIIIR